MLKPGERVGNWIVDGPLAEGGMGAVYRVRSPLTKRLVAALKIMKATGEPDARSRFVREAEALAALHHPAVVRVMEFAEDASRGLLYLVMELAEGETLRERIERGPLELQEALSILLPLAQGLEHAHNCGVFHRDLKPSNIILCSDRSVRLVDFGISAAQHAEPLTNSGRLGTLAYLPPEAFKGEKTKPARADVYGFGLLAYEALTGRRSFPVDPKLTPAAAAASVGVRKLQQSTAMELPERFPLLLRELVRRATSSEPTDRPRMADIRAGLEELAGRPATLSSRPPAETRVSPVPVPDEATMRVPDPMEEAVLPASPPSRPPRPYLLAVGLAALVALGATVLMGRSAQRVSSADGVAAGALASPAPAPTPSRRAPAVAPSTSLPESAREAERKAPPLPEPEATPAPPEKREASPGPPPREPASVQQKSVEKPPEPVEEEAADEAPAATELGGRWELTLEEARTHDASPSRRGGYRLTLQQEGDRIFGRGYKLTENGIELPEERRTAIEVDGHVEGQQLVLNFVERGGGTYNSGWIRWVIAPGGRALSGRFASAGGQSGGSSAARRLR